MGGKNRGSVVFAVVVTLFVSAGALLMMVIIGLAGAPASILLSLALAAVPIGPLVACYLWLDRYEPEPKLLLASGLLWGACAATAASILIGGIGGLVVPITDEQSLTVVAPVVEEASKGAFLLLLLWWRRAELDGLLDGIVYAGMVGIGFAFTENILYLAAAYDGTDGLGPGGTEALTTTFVVRCLLSPFAHPLFTAFTGIGVGIAVGSRVGWVRVAAPVGGYLLAVLTHALWNGSTVFGFGSFALVYLVLMVPALVALTCLAIWARRTEAQMLVVSLQDAARRGLVPATDIVWVANLRARRTARRHARQMGGVEAEAQVRDYQQAMIELGFLHYRYLRGTAPADFVERGQHYVARIGAVRPDIAFPGQMVPTR